MKLPRDLSGGELVKLLRKFGYEAVRQTGSHIRVKSSQMGSEHQVTIPAHSPLKVGTLSGILGEVCTYLEIPKEALAQKLFG